ncbi:MAG: YezD family protein [Candidatus Omnitrophica bacterium]|nr:YezD family protein [Candidatus Omnitrophota bacterium]
MGVNVKEEKAVFEEIVKFIKEVHFGEVVITIHDSEIVQVEKREKKRFKIQKRLHKQS